MATEIERKFLVDPKWDPASSKPFAITHIRQGYLSIDPNRTVRIRTLDVTHEAYRDISRRVAAITVKGLKVNASAGEWEYEIPYEDAIVMMDSLIIPGMVIDKTRYLISVMGMCDDESTWEVDVFHGRHEGLVVAEIELGHEDEAYNSAPWLRREVTTNGLYANSFLSSAQQKVVDELILASKMI
jgi:adenylate cyclase